MPSGTLKKRPTRASPLVLIAIAVVFSFLRADAAAGQILAQYDYEDLELRGIGVEGWRVWPSGIEPTNGVGVRADLGLVGPYVRVSPSARFWASSLDRAEVDRLAEQIILICERQVAQSCPAQLDLGEVKLSDLELAVEAHYLPFSVARVTPYLGLGVSLHLLNGRGDFIDGTFVEDLLDSVAPGIGPILGIDVRLGSAITLGAEARLMLASDVRYGAVGLNGVWSLPGPRPPGEELGLARGRE